MARKEFETLTPQMFYILLSLKEPHYGYEIMQKIEAATHGNLTVGAGTLYALLPKFLEEGYIRTAGEEKRRKLYVLTEDGKKKLKDEVKKLVKMTADYREVFGE
jgi:DNA-binding PadR family transcriptional regulator